MTKFNLNHSKAAKLLKAYNLDLISYKSVNAGIENSSAFVLTNEGRFVLRVYRQSNKTLKWIKRELNFMSFLSNAGMPVPEVKNNVRGNGLSTCKGGGKTWRYILLQHIPGKHLKSTDYDLIPELARYQAMMHKEALNFSKTNILPKNYTQGLLNFFATEAKSANIKLKNKKFWSDVKVITEGIISGIETHLDVLQRLPNGLVHLDYDSDNIIVNKGKVVGIIDFDDISNLPFVVDLANTLWWWAYMNKEKDYKKILKLYLKHYQNERLLNKGELSFIPSFMRLRNIAVGMVFEADRVKHAGQKEFSGIIDFDEILAVDARKADFLV